MRHPSFLPSGKAILFTVGMADSYSYDDADIGVLSLDTGKKRILIRGGTSPRYAPSGHLIYARAGTLLAVPFDSEKLEVTGQPFPVANGVFMSANTGMAAFSISETGHLVHATGPEERGTRVPVWVDKRGHKAAAAIVPAPKAVTRRSRAGHRGRGSVARHLHVRLCAWRRAHEDELRRRESLAVVDPRWTAADVPLLENGNDDDVVDAGGSERRTRVANEYRKHAEP